MKKIMKNKKGFTLIELLAVIVLLAIVGVVGANLIITRLNKGKVDTFVNDYRDIVKEVAAGQIEGTDDCNDETTDPNIKKCEGLYDYNSSEISLKVALKNTGTDYETEVVVKPAKDGTFKKINLAKYYCSTKTGSSGDYKCGADDTRAKLPNSAVLSSGNTITGTF